MHNDIVEWMGIVITACVTEAKDRQEWRKMVKSRGRNKPKLPLVRRISDMLQTTCPPTCPLVQVLVHFVGPKLDALDRQIAANVRDDMGLTDTV